MLGEFVSQLFDSFFSVCEDHTLGNDHIFIELDQSTEFLAVFLKRDIKLLDTIEC